MDKIDEIRSNIKTFVQEVDKGNTPHINNLRTWVDNIGKITNMPIFIK